VIRTDGRQAPGNHSLQKVHAHVDVFLALHSAAHAPRHVAGRCIGRCIGRLRALAAHRE